MTENQSLDIMFHYDRSKFSGLNNWNGEKISSIEQHT